MTQDIPITPEMSVHKAHEKLPEGVRSIETILVYRVLPGHPDPGKPFKEPIEGPQEEPDRQKAPEEDARLVESMKRSLDKPAPDDRVVNRSRIFGAWRADDVSEWGDRRSFPVVANSRDLQVFHKVVKSDCYYNHFLQAESSLSYLTKQSGKELNEKRLSEVERKLFAQAKTKEIDNLLGSNAIEMITSKEQIKWVREKYSHRIMPRRRKLEKWEKIGRQRPDGSFWDTEIPIAFSLNVLHQHLPAPP